MKNKWIFAGITGIALLFTMTLTACGGGGNSPSAVAKKFYAAAEKGDAKALEAVSSKEVAQMILAFGEKVPTTIKEAGKITNAVETIDGDTAKVTLSFENGDDQNLDLVKVDGKWKVTIKK